MRQIRVPIDTIGYVVYSIYGVPVHWYMYT